MQLIEKTIILDMYLWSLYLDNNYFVGAVMTDLSKAFDCIPYDLVIVKLEAYGSDNYIIRYVYSYVKNRRQCVKINNTWFNDNFP